MRFQDSPAVGLAEEFPRHRRAVEAGANFEPAETKLADFADLDDGDAATPPRPGPARWRLTLARLASKDIVAKDKTNRRTPDTPPPALFLPEESSSDSNAS